MAQHMYNASSTMYKKSKRLTECISVYSIAQVNI